MATDRRRKTDVNPKPFEDKGFRLPSLDAGTLLDRRRFEANLRRYGILGKINAVEESIKSATSKVTIIESAPVSTGCYWTKVGDDVWYTPGDVYCGHNLIVENIFGTTAPALKIINKSDTAYDPIMQFAVGATPATKWTHGLRDSDFDNLLWCNDDELSDSNTAGGGWSDHLLITDFSNNRVKNHSAANLTYVSQKATSGAKYVCADNEYYYVTYAGLHKVNKYRISDNSLIWSIGTQGSGDDQFNTPNGICTDYTWLYICDQLNYRIKKHLCSTGAFVAEVGGRGTGLGQFILPTNICTDGTWLYEVEGSPGAAPRIKKHLCSDLTGVAQITADGHIDGANLQGICIAGNYLYLVNSNNTPLNAVFKYTRALTYVSEYGANGSGDTQFTGPRGICTDDTYLYIVDTGNERVKKHQASDYAFVAKVGTFGNGDSQFSGPVDACINLVGLPTIARVGRLLRLHQDGSHFDIFTNLDVYDRLWFHEDSVARAEYIAIKAPATVVSYELVLPGADAAGALVSNGAGILSFTSVCPLNAKYIVQEANATLTAEQSLGALATGILKNTTTAGVGVLSIAVGADLPAHEHDAAYISIISSPGTNKFPYQTAGGELVDSTYSAASFEAALGNPGDDDYFLSSKMDGTRSWAPSGGALALDELTDVDATGPDDDDILRFDSVSGNWQNEALPAASNHKLLSATHDDTTADTVVRGDMIVGIGATPKWERLAKGTEGYVLTMGADEPLWATPAVGAPSGAKYIVGLADASLSAEKVKKALYANYDIDDTPASPNAVDDEFDDSSFDGKWTIVNNPAGANAISETAFPGYIWLGLPEDATQTFDSSVRVKQAAPEYGTAWEIIAKISIGVEGLESSTDAGEWTSAGVYLGNSTNDQFVAAIMQFNDGPGDQFSQQAQGAIDNGSGGWATASTFNNYQIVPACGTYYVKLRKATTAAYTSSNSYDMYYSFNGILWQHMGRQTKTFTTACDEVGIIFRAPKSQGGDPVAHAVVDFFRRIV